MVGKVKELGVDPETQRYLIEKLQQPMETESLINAAKGQPRIASEIYGASLLAIKVDTQAEKDYLNRLAAVRDLSPDVTDPIQKMVGLQVA